MNERPEITVIIPVWNGERRLGALLEAIASQTLPRSRFEVIVVDNGSTDGTVAIAEGFPFVKLLSEPQPGSYRARNRALAEALGEYVLFTDGDCVPAPDWIEQAVAAAERFPDAGVCAGHVRMFREAKGDPFSARYEELTAFNQRRNVEVRLLHHRQLALPAQFDALDRRLQSGSIVWRRRRMLAPHRRGRTQAGLCTRNDCRSSDPSQLARTDSQASARRRGALAPPWVQSQADLLLGEKASA